MKHNIKLFDTSKTLKSDFDGALTHLLYLKTKTKTNKGINVCLVFTWPTWQSFSQAFF